MSAFILPDEHINYIVNGLALETSLASLHNSLSDPILQLIGEELIKENYASVNYRYEDNADPEEPFKFQRIGSIHKAQLLKAVRCYDYQSCEHPEWKSSEAYKLITHLEARLKLDVDINSVEYINAEYVIGDEEE